MDASSLTVSFCHFSTIFSSQPLNQPRNTIRTSSAASEQRQTPSQSNGQRSPPSRTSQSKSVQSVESAREKETNVAEGRVGRAGGLGGLAGAPGADLRRNVAAGDAEGDWEADWVSAVSWSAMDGEHGVRGGGCGAPHGHAGHSHSEGTGHTYRPKRGCG